MKSMGGNVMVELDGNETRIAYNCLKEQVSEKDKRIKEFEAKCAAMRKVLESVRYDLLDEVNQNMVEVVLKNV